MAVSMAHLTCWVDDLSQEFAANLLRQSFADSEVSGSTAFQSRPKLGVYFKRCCSHAS